MMILVIALWTLLLANSAAGGFLWKCALIGESYDIRHTRCTCMETGYFECHKIYKAEFTSRKEAILPSLAKILRRRYNTPPPLTTSTKGTTNSPPPYTTQTPPNPHTTDAPTSPVTHGAATVNHHTRSPPPPKAVLG
ncbi:uncharacterized protein LOC128189408 [Crassostrea angulata]|uniref:EGF-like domain-containing protein n=2 Tax=Magallana gigas TaxID=29159 RepID=A0A8W8K6V8_MAGGI|nr:uncharacterized protein LOC128189408 [Crassostrea angulata]